MDIRDTLWKCAVGAASTGALALCGAVINSSREDSLQDHQLSQLETHQAETDETLKQLDVTVRQLDKDVAILHERMKEHGER